MAHCKHLPTPEEIQTRCLEVQETWSDTVRMQRAGSLRTLTELRRRPYIWAVPTVSNDDLRAAVEDQ